MVCLGNICRSPIADGLLRRKVKENNLNILVDSAGTAAYHIGKAPDSRMCSTAEQFGTNLRSTATTSVPNMIRGSVPIMLIGFDYLKQSRSVIISAAIVGAIAFALGIYATLTISETHNREMDFVE